MSVVQHKSADKTVATIPDRNALSPRRDHMTVVVLDAAGDVNVLSGKATYKWNEASESWLLLAKENGDTLNFASESKTIVDDGVTASNIPVNGVIWDVYVLDEATKVITQVEWGVSGANITITPDTPGQFNNKRLNYKYAYGTISQQMDAALQTHISDVNGHQIAGEIRAFARATAPAGWLVCDGSAVSRSTYADLFAAVGTLYGAGDGSTTFALPNLIDRMARGGAAGQSGGADSVVLSLGQMPVHKHDVSIGVLTASESATSFTPNAGVKLAGSWYEDIASLAPLEIKTYGAGDATGTLGGVTETSKGGTTPVPTLPAYTAVLYCIAAGGSAT